jgi:hypothetical protein
MTRQHTIEPINKTFEEIVDIVAKHPAKVKTREVLKPVADKDVFDNLVKKASETKIKKPD